MLSASAARPSAEPPRAKNAHLLVQLIVPALPTWVEVQFMFEVSMDGMTGVATAGVVTASAGMKEGDGLFIMR